MIKRKFHDRGRRNLLFTVVPVVLLLVAVFIFAILIHLLHGTYNVGSLAIYTAAALAIAMGKGN